MKRTHLSLSLLNNEMKNMKEEGREINLRWSTMHMYSSAQVAKLLAMKRGLNPAIASLTAVLHDIYVIRTGQKENHAMKAEPLVREFIANLNNGPWKSVPKTSEAEIEIIVRSIVNHSNKDEFTDDLYVELMKDVDSIDRYFYGVKDKRESYIKRYKKVLTELGIENEH